MTPEVEAYFSQFEGPQLQAVKSTFEAFQRALPGATDLITWGLPTLSAGGSHLISVGGFSGHNSIFPGPQAIGLVGDKLLNYTVSKGTVHFDKDTALPGPLVKAFAKATISALNSRYPKKDGTFLQYYPSGFVKQRGKYRNGQMHSKWEWYRLDGSLMRSGAFRDGEKTGEWVTYDRQSRPI